MRRVSSLVLAFAALPGLLGGLGSVVVHEHEDGDEPHHHADLVGHVHLDHEHEGDDHHSHDHGADSEPPGDDGTVPPDGERHGHYGELRAQALRRGSATAHSVLEPASWAATCWTLGRWVPSGPERPGPSARSSWSSAVAMRTHDDAPRPGDRLRI